MADGLCAVLNGLLLFSEKPLQIWQMYIHRADRMREDLSGVSSAKESVVFFFQEWYNTPIAAIPLTLHGFITAKRLLYFNLNSSISGEASHALTSRAVGRESFALAAFEKAGETSLVLRALCTAFDFQL